MGVFTLAIWSTFTWTEKFINAWTEKFINAWTEKFTANKWQVWIVWIDLYSVNSWLARLLAPTTKLRRGNIFTGICQSFCSRGGGGEGVSGRLPQADTPWADSPSPRQTPPRQTLPSGRHPLRPVHSGIHTPFPVHSGIHRPPPAQCMLGHPPAATAADGTHPTGMHTCLWHFWATLQLWGSSDVRAYPFGVPSDVTDEVLAVRCFYDSCEHSPFFRILLVTRTVLDSRPAWIRTSSLPQVSWYKHECSTKY